MNLTRIGKIARLPRTVREELNQRLDDGEAGPELTTWLNSLPDAQEVLAEHFRGRPISENNLSAWRQGGFLDWLRHQEARASVTRLVEESDDFDDAADEWELASRASLLVVTEIVQLIQASRTSEDLVDRRKLVFGAAKQLARIRRMDHEATRVDVEDERWDAEQSEKYWKQQKKILKAKQWAEHVKFWFNHVAGSRPPASPDPALDPDDSAPDPDDLPDPDDSPETDPDNDEPITPSAEVGRETSFRPEPEAPDAMSTHQMDPQPDPTGPKPQSIPANSRQIQVLNQPSSTSLEGDAPSAPTYRVSDVGCSQSPASVDDP